MGRVRAAAIGALEQWPRAFLIVCDATRDICVKPGIMVRYQAFALALRRLWRRWLAYLASPVSARWLAM